MPTEDGKATVMDPEPGQVWVEFMKDHEEGVVKSNEESDSGLDVDFKKGHKTRIYLSRVEPPASERLHVGDRLVALNGKSVESFNGDLDAIREVLNYHNVIEMIVDPTLKR
mmetsp:Transcript_23097/g.56962  ORF Transcript_23097/g.56962 Transcript_23097/m.56962 type:complete len:111 (-) Transcript_23097:386-718(-)